MIRGVAVVGMLALAGCTSAGPPPGSFGQPIETSATSSGSPVNDGWQANEKLMPPRDLGAPLGTIGPSRQGQTPDGYAYTIYSDGSGGIDTDSSELGARWSIDCKNDVMTDKKGCTARNRDLGLAFTLDGATPSWLCLIEHDFPGRKGVIRIGKGAPVETVDKGCIPWARVSKLTDAREASLRVWKWPYDYPRDKTTDVSSMKSAVGLTRFIYEKIDKISFSM